MSKIICPICDEELGNCIDDIPEKCPICDTRKHEILVELKAKDSSLEITPPKPVVSPSFAEEFNHPVVVEEEIATKEKYLEEDNEEIIFTDVPSSSKQTATKPWEIEADSTDAENMQYTPEDFGENQVSLIGSPTEPSEISESQGLYSEQEGVPQYISPISNESNIAEEKITPNKKEEITSLVKPLPLIAPTLRPSESITQQLAKSLEEEEASDTGESNHTMHLLKHKKDTSHTPSKSGASGLETLPGFQRCTSCQAVYPKEYNQDCVCGNASLTIEKGFIPGDYLILYNSVKKAIAYFKLDKQGSIFIGRSSERGSDRDIDLSVAWKHYYYRNATSEDDFKEKMRLLKGISRKHALIRFDKEEKKYILFHLSEKNYTVAELPTGEKRTRTPQNRNRLDLESDTILSMGNQKDFIIMRYRKIV